MKLTAIQLRQAADLKDRISDLENELEGLLTGDYTKMTNPIPLPLPRQPRLTPKRRRMSAEARAKIRLAAKRRWKKAKAAGRNSL